jgi:hypothetical protein
MLIVVIFTKSSHGILIGAHKWKNKVRHINNGILLRNEEE